MAQATSLQALSSPLRMTSGAEWAKSVYGPPGTFRAPIVFDDHFAGRFEHWSIDGFDEGCTIRNIATDFWACAEGDKVITSAAFSQEKCKWYINFAGEGAFNIKIPNADSLWTVRSEDPWSPKMPFLDPADGSDAQRFSMWA